MIKETEITEPGNNPLDEKQFHQIKTSLVNSQNICYTEFKKKISPDYFKIWFDIGLGWISLIACAVIGFYLDTITESIILKMMISLIDALLAGLVISYLINFFHEASHFNIAAKKNVNDLLANIFLGVLQAQGIKHYRIIHWQHHVHHGTIKDTEHSYFESLSFRFLIESLTGVRAIRIFLSRNNIVSVGTENKNLEVLKKERSIMLFSGVAFHTMILILFFLLHKYWLMAIWLTGFGTFFPFFSSLRQLLEHRSEWAEKKINYSTINHGKITRIFKSGLFASTLGSAGFTRHLLHHLEPQISYTNLKQVELFLLDTKIAPQVKKQCTSYLKVFLTLFGK